MAGIYLHVPFCRHACTYCDFHFSTNLNRLPELVETILTEIDIRHEYLDKKVLESIYFGGGTPSLLHRNHLQSIVDKLNQYYSWDPSAEITLEANPEDIDADSLNAWKQIGINRLSIGIQSFLEEELQWMNRKHTAIQSIDSVKMAQDAGFDNISIDLIYGSKFQNEASWRETLVKAIGLQTQHVSAYNLTIEEKTPLGLYHAKGKEPSVNEDLSSRQFEILRQELQGAGFLHYEISNFGKPGFFAVHNSNYWKGQAYLGLGPSAHSFNGASRQWNVKSNARYIQLVQERAPFFELEQLSDKDRFNEYVLTGLRTLWGCDLQVIQQQFGEAAAQHFETGIRRFTGFYEVNKTFFVLNEQGRLRADGIASALFLL